MASVGVAPPADGSTGPSGVICRPIALRSKPAAAKLRARAGVAQLVEQRIRNAWVGGSIPFSGTIFQGD